ncbi:MAG: gamma-glutamylcyclotransferase [Parasphingorhabdus sp.]
MIHYLAYGSNLHPERLRRRVPSSHALGYVQLNGYQLTFNKRGIDASGKCDAYFTGNSADYLIGVVYSLQADERIFLDRAEDLGNSYQLCTERVIFNQNEMELFFYVASAEFIQPGIAPYYWYKSFVTEGAKFHNLPAHYISKLSATPAKSDPDPDRHQLHQEILDAL